MRIWLPLAILLSVAWLFVVSVLASRGGDGARSTTPPPVDAATLLRQSQAAMLELDSFQFQVSARWAWGPLGYSVAWHRPDNFHVLFRLLEDQYDQDGRTIRDDGFLETIAVGDAVYSRRCPAGGGGCEPWKEDLRDDIYVPGLVSELEPMWGIELLGLMSDPEIVGQEDVEGVACTRVRGKVNILRAMIQSWRRAEENWGPMNWGEECTGAPSEPGSETQEQCHHTTLDEYIAMLEDPLRQQDLSPPSVEVWIGQEDGLLRRLQFPQGEEPAEGSFTFSQFDEVTVEPPK